MLNFNNFDNVHLDFEIRVSRFTNAFKLVNFRKFKFGYNFNKHLENSLIHYLN